jgi:hypothetical protein
MERRLIEKSSRHSKIAGDFGEAFVLYWLSKHGYECARIDHTGIDLIASKRGGQVLGISVKARTRSEGKETNSIMLRLADIDGAGVACRTFRCEPWFAFVVDAADMLRVFMMSAATLLELFSPGQQYVTVRMSPTWIAKYKAHAQVKWFEVHVTEHAGWVTTS